MIERLNNYLACRPPTSRLRAVGVLYGQLELLDEVCAVQSPLLPDVEQPLHGFLTAPFCLPADRVCPREVKQNRVEKVLVRHW